jgi:hypothetical protein
MLSGEVNTNFGHRSTPPWFEPTIYYSTLTITWFLHHWWASSLQKMTNGAYNISAISLRPVLLVEVTRVPGENQRPATCHWQTSSWAGFKLTLVMIRTDCIGSYKSNYHTITAMTVPLKKKNLFALLYFEKY